MGARKGPLAADYTGGCHEQLYDTLDLQGMQRAVNGHALEYAAEADCWAGVHDQLMHGILPQLRTYANAYAKPMFVWEK